MMPSMELSHTKDPIERTDAAWNIRVLARSVDCRKNEDQSHHIASGAQQNQWNQLGWANQKNVQGVKTHGVKPIQAR